VRRHDRNNGLSPVQFEKQYFEKQLSVKQTRGLPTSALRFQEYSARVTLTPIGHIY